MSEPRKEEGTERVVTPRNEESGGGESEESVRKGRPRKCLPPALSQTMSDNAAEPHSESRRSRAMSRAHRTPTLRHDAMMRVFFPDASSHRDLTRKIATHARHRAPVRVSAHNRDAAPLAEPESTMASALRTSNPRLGLNPETLTLDHTPATRPRPSHDV